MIDIYEFLRTHGITYERCDHPAVFTCEEAERLVPELPGMHSKNLFLRDKAGKRHILVCVPHEKTVDLKAFAETIGMKGVSFASPERLMTYLGVTPGSATILGLVTDRDHAVEVVIDEQLWKAALFQCHPLINTATLIIGHDGIAAFLKATGHEPKVVDIPEKIQN